MCDSVTPFLCALVIPAPILHLPKTENKAHMSDHSIGYPAHAPPRHTKQLGKQRMGNRRNHATSNQTQASHLDATTGIHYCPASKLQNS